MLTNGFFVNVLSQKQNHFFMKQLQGALVPSEKQQLPARNKEIENRPFIANKCKSIASPEWPSRWGLGHFSAQIRLPDQLPARVWATFGLKTAQDRQHRPQERPKTVNIGNKSGPRPPT